MVVDGDTLNADSVNNAAAAQRFGIFHPAATGKNKVVVIENEHLWVSLSSHGAKPSMIRLKEYKTYQKTPLLLADPDSGNYEFRFFLGNTDMSTKDLHFTAENLGSDGVRFKAATSRPRQVAPNHLPVGHGSYFMDVRCELVGLEAEVDAAQRGVQLGPDGLAQRKVPRPGNCRNRSVYYKYFSDDRELPERDQRGREGVGGAHELGGLQTGLLHRGHGQRDGFAGNGSEICHHSPWRTRTFTKRYERQALLREGPRRPRWTCPCGCTSGPNHYGTLRRTEIAQFDKIIDLGWGIFGWMNKWLVIPIFNFLDGWGWNYGIIILVLTMVIKMLLDAADLQELRLAAPRCAC